MRCLKSNPCLIFLFPLFFFFFIVSTFFSPAYGAPQDRHILEGARIPDFRDVSNQQHRHGIVKPSTRRIAVETAQNSTYLILAAERTHRRDPLNGLDFYTGGWNITDEHYIYSVAFSAAGPFAIALGWFLVFGMFLCCFCLCCCCCRKRKYGYSPTAYAVSIVCLTLFTVVAICGIGFLYKGQEKFQESIVGTLDFVLQEANTVVQNLKDLLDNLLAAKNTSLGKRILPEDILANIDDIQKLIDEVSAKFGEVTNTNSREIRQFLDPLRLVLLVAAVTLFVLAFLGYLCSILGLQCVVYCLVILGWILVAVAFIMSGMFLLVHNVVADTCVAMGEWLHNPNAHSALESIIPKVDNQTAQTIFNVTKGVTLGLVAMLNLEITNVYNDDVPPNSGPAYFNQTGPFVPNLCNPYNPDLSDRPCAPGEVSVNNASQVWKSYVCQMPASGICETTGRLSPEGYSQMATIANVSKALNRDMPFVVGLIDSTYLKELFGDIRRDYCPGLDRYTKWTYLGFITSSVAVMLSLILWMVYARERNHRKYTKKIDRKSADTNPFAYG